MELKIKDYQLPESIDFNFEEMKKELTLKAETYSNMVYTESDIKSAKADRAELNKLKKDANDKRIAMQKLYMVPFDAFKAKVDELISIIDKPITIIDEQVKAYELKQKQEKEEAIRKLFDEKNTYDWLTLEKVADAKWKNASTSLKSIGEELDITLASIEQALESIKGLEYAADATEVFKQRLSLPDALAENQRLHQMAEKLAQIEREKAERQAQLEAQKAEEAKKQEEVKAPEPEIKEPEKEKEPETTPVQKQWMALKVKIDDADFEAIEEFLNERGIEHYMQ